MKHSIYHKFKFFVSLVTAGILIFINALVLLSEQRLGSFSFFSVVILVGVRFFISIIQNHHAKSVHRDIPYPSWFDFF